MQVAFLLYGPVHRPRLDRPARRPQPVPDLDPITVADQGRSGATVGTLEIMPPSIDDVRAPEILWSPAGWEPACCWRTSAARLDSPGARDQQVN